MTHLRAIAATLVLTLVAGLGFSTAEAAQRWSVRATATSINSGVRYNDGNHLGTSAPTRRDAAKHQLQMQWTGTTPLRVTVYWSVTCWDIGASGRVRVVGYASNANVRLSRGTTWTKTWNQTRDACDVGVEAVDTYRSESAKTGKLTLRIRDLR